jgi:hypothetical protein
VDGLARVTLPVSVNTKFWDASKSRVTDPVLLVSVKVDPRCALVKVVLALEATMFAPARLVAPVPPFASGSVPVTSAVRSTPAFLIVTAPELTEKLSLENDAIPLLLAVASSPAIVRVSVALTVASIPSPEVTVRV